MVSPRLLVLLLSITPATIHDLAQRAALLAADGGRPLAMAHVQHAARLEFARLGRPLPPL